MWAIIINADDHQHRKTAKFFIPIPWFLSNATRGPAEKFGPIEEFSDPVW